MVTLSTTPSPREMEVILLIAQGCTYADVAESLVISVRTVQTHARNAKAKVGAASLPHLVYLTLAHPTSN